MNATDIKFRASEIGLLMTNPRGKSETLSETCKTQLINIFVREKYGRKEEVTSKFLEHGIANEQNAITLFSRVTKQFYKKNEVRLTNDYVTGEVDLYIGKSLETAEETFDTKCSYSANTFFRAQKDELNPHYVWQGITYMALTGAKKHSVVYCLVNGTETAINDEKRKLQWRLGVLDPNNPTPEYLEKAQQVERNHIFDMAGFQKEYPHFNFDTDLSKWDADIPMEERIHSVSFDRNEDEIKKIYERVKQCREYMNRYLFKADKDFLTQKVEAAGKLLVPEIIENKNLQIK